MIKQLRRTTGRGRMLRVQGVIRRKNWITMSEHMTGDPGPQALQYRLFMSEALAPTITPVLTIMRDQLMKLMEIKSYFLMMRISITR